MKELPKVIVLGMLSILIILVGTMLVTAGYTTQVYDSFPGTTVNWSLWVNASLQGNSAQHTAEVSSNILLAKVLVDGLSYHRFQVTSSKIPNIYYIKNITFYNRLYTNQVLGGVELSFAELQLFGSTIDHVYKLGASTDVNYNYTARKNYASGLYDVYRNGVYNTSINGSITNITLYVQSYSNTGDGSFGQAFIGYLNYTYWNTTTLTEGVSPINNQIVSNATNLTFTVYAYSPNGLKNTTLFIDGANYQTFPITGSYSNLTNLSVNYGTLGSHNYSYYTCDLTHACENSSVNSFNVVTYTYNSETYNATTYETSSEDLVLNMTYQDTLSSSYLIYNGTSYSVTPTLDAGNNYIFTKTLDIPTGSGAKSFYWNLNFVNSGTYNTTQHTQTVNALYFVLCNSTINTPFLNLTFKDETALTSINATIDSSTWSYYLGSGNINKSFLFQNSSLHYSYAFCLNVNRTLHKNVELTYASSGYPQRVWVNLDDLTNTVTNKILYLLSSSEGIYSTYQVQTETGGTITGVLVTAERQISGTWNTLQTGSTDDAGAITLWLNPNYEHRITFSKSGYTTEQVTIKPSSSTYTVILTTPTTEEASYNSSTEGMTWTYGVIPSIATLTPNTNYTFWFNITANYSNLVSCKIQMIDNSSTVISSVTGCTSTGGYLSSTINVANNVSIRMKMMINTGEGFYTLDSDAYWFLLKLNTPTRGTITKFLENISRLNQFGEGNRAEASRILLFFLLFFIVLAFLSYQTNWDFATTGGNIMLLLPIIWMASIAGFLDLNYYPEIAQWGAFMNQYTVALIASGFSLGWIFNKWADGGR